jgi:hypothetical protein
MANETMVLLEKIVVPSGGASSVTFTSIPQSYTDLNVLASTRSTGDQASVNYCQLRLELNGNTSNYSDILLYGIGGLGAGSLSYTNAYVTWAGASTDSTATASTFSNVSIYIPNYASSNNKSISSDGATESNATNSILTLDAGLWANSSAITSLKFTLETGNFAEYSTFYLYGVAKQGVTPTNAPAATGGDKILFDGTYWYHVFTSTGTFTPKKALTADCLVIAGGGAGSGTWAAGGGAGGLQYTASQSFTSGVAYTTTVGAGGTYAANTRVNGTNSNITGTGLSLTAAVGGGGGAYRTSGTGANGADGGSGGGAIGSYGASTNTGGSPTTGQGYAGGNSSVNTAGHAGGGGAGGAGGNVSSRVPTAGGVGSSSYSSWGSATSTGQNSGGTYYYAGGGGGGAPSNPAISGGSGGTGGGGAGGAGSDGGTAGTGTAGTANTGGGGGGGGQGVTDGAGGNGGSGIIIVRYAA